MDLWRSSKSSTGVYLSPANSPDFPELDTSECWSDSEFEDDLDDDEAFEVNQEQDSVSQCSSHTSSSEVSAMLFLFIFLFTHEYRNCFNKRRGA